MKKLLVPVLLLLMTNCVHFHREITIPKTQIQELLDKQFTNGKNHVFMGFTVDSPAVYFSGQNIGLKVTYYRDASSRSQLVQLPGWSPFLIGTADIKGDLTYDQGCFYLSKIKIVDLVVREEGSENKKGKFKGRMLKLTGNWVGDVPLYRLDDNTYKQILAKRFFKKLRVEGDNIVVTLGF